MDDRKSKSRAACLPRARLIHAVKALKNVLDGVLRNAHTRILHQKLRFVLRVAGRHMDASPGVVILDAVFNEVKNDLIRVVLHRKHIAAPV